MTRRRRISQDRDNPPDPHAGRPTAATRDDAARLRALVVPADAAAFARQLDAFYQDAARADRTPRAILYLHLGMASGMIGRLAAAQPRRDVFAALGLRLLAAINGNVPAGPGRDQLIQEMTALVQAAGAVRVPPLSAALLAAPGGTRRDFPNDFGTFATARKRGHRRHRRRKLPVKP